ncbi:MAG: hypothetical protein HY744_26700 [Deltaproteobacteria bacterium]|nr:hypothetical protein [Deltaproteobacteria bacterium]
MPRTLPPARSLCLTLLAGGCYQIAGFDELGFADLAVDGGPDGGCREDEDCPAAACAVARCQAGECISAPAADGTTCSAWGADVCSGGRCVAERYQWARLLGDGNAAPGRGVTQVATAVAADAAGGAVVVGEAFGRVDFGDAVRTSHDGAGPDAFVVRLDAQGMTAWSRLLGDEHKQSASSVAVDASGIVVAGSFAGRFEAVGGCCQSAPSGQTEPSPGWRRTMMPSTDVFVAKLTPAGEWIYARSFGDGAEQLALGVAVDDGGRAAVVGAFEGTAKFGATVLESAGQADAFVAMLDPFGHPVWAKALGGQGQQHASAVAIDTARNLVVCGSFTGTMDEAPRGTGAGLPLAAAGGSNFDVFVVKLSPDGDVLWARRFGDTASQQAHAVAVSEMDEVVVVGEMAGAIEVGKKTLQSAGGSGDAFVLRLGADGSPDAERSRSFGDLHHQVARAVAVDGSDNVVVAGSFAGVLDFGGRILSSPFGDEDIFLAKLGPELVPLYAYRFGELGVQVGQALALAGSQVLLAGYLEGAVSLGGPVLVSGGDKDAFVARYGP